MVSSDEETGLKGEDTPSHLVLSGRAFLSTHIEVKVFFMVTFIHILFLCQTVCTPFTFLILIP